MTETTKCAVCGRTIYNDFETDTKQLVSGEMVCGGCVEESCLVVQCDFCGEWVLAKDAVKCPSGITCPDCFEEHAEDFADDLPTYDDFQDEQEELEEDGDYEVSADGYLDYIDDRLLGTSANSKMRKRVLEIIKERLDEDAA
jgi:hypothetical protein